MQTPPTVVIHSLVQLLLVYNINLYHHAKKGSSYIYVTHELNLI